MIHPNFPYIRPRWHPPSRSRRPTEGDVRLGTDPDSSLLVSYGATAGLAALWAVGLAMLAVGGLIPPAVRFTAADPDAL